MNKPTKTIFGSGFPILLAPMAGITDMPFRELCMDFGAHMTYTEMISAKGLSYNSKNSFALLELSPKEIPCGVQLFGSEPSIMADMTRRLCDELCGRIRLIDINMGCPAPKITGNGEGSALMLNIPLAQRIVSAVKNASTVPVTVKHRLGFDDAHRNAVEFAVAMESAGADALTVHGRTRAQMYSGKADYDAIAEVVNAVDIPVIGNGDVFCGEDALRLKAATGCDGIMVARGAQGNPLIFKEINCALRGEPYTVPDWEQRRAVAIRHAKRHIEGKGERSFIELRKHMAWYTKGIVGSAQVRVAINTAPTAEALLDILEKI